MKFRFLLWMLGFLMGKASRKNPAFQQQLVDKDMVFQLQTLDGKVARHFKVKDQRITSHSGLYPDPVFAIAFKDAANGVAADIQAHRQANVLRMDFFTQTGSPDAALRAGHPARWCRPDRGL